MAYKIVLDAGHGGEDPGAVYKDRKEKDDNLKLTLAVGKILEENGVDVVYTRTTDIYQTPFEKAKAANEAGAVFFISFPHISYLCHISQAANACRTYVQEPAAQNRRV